jgi:flavin reductase (DIM6/NTAB) family NADH-FMN oxidoreductase RutF
LHKIIEPKALYWGNTVILLTTTDTAGNAYITPMSSSWSLGKNIVIGLSLNGKAIENIEQHPEVVLNVASSNLANKIETIAPFTGKFPVPPEKQKSGFSYCEDKFVSAGLTPEISLYVRPPRITECPIQVECAVEHITKRGSFAIVELQTRCVHADEGILKGYGIIDAALWQPLIYNFRSYHGITERLGQNFRFEN